MAESKDFAAEAGSAKVVGTVSSTDIAEPVAPPLGLRAMGPRITFHFVGEWDAETSYALYDVVRVNGTSYIGNKINIAKGINPETDNNVHWVKWNDPNAQVELLQQTVNGFDARITEAETEAINAAADAAAAKKASADNATAIGAEATRATAAEAANANAIKAEATRAKAAEAANTAAIEAEATRATTAESAEQEARENADNGLSSRIKVLEDEPKTKVFDKLVCIGDSWLEGYSSVGSFTDWGSILGQILKATTHNEAKGGCGWHHAKDGITFNDLVTRAKNAVNANEINCVVIAGGINDRKDSYSQVQSAAKKTIQNALSAFPNAEIFVFPMLLAGRFISNNSMDIMNAITIGCTSAQNTRVHVYDDCYDWLYDSPSLHADAYHPNQEGQIRTANMMMQVIYGGAPVFHQSSVLFNGNAGYTIFDGAYCRRNGSTCTAYIGTIQNVTKDKIFCSFSKGYDPGAFFSYFVDQTGAVNPMRASYIDDKHWGFSPNFGNGNQMYSNPTWSIEDND